MYDTSNMFTFAGFILVVLVLSVITVALMEVIKLYMSLLRSLNGDVLMNL